MLMYTFLCFFADLGIQLNLGNGDFLIVPDTYIVGKVRSAGLTICIGNALHPKECYPTGGVNVKVGDFIDFSWRMTGVTGVLIYAIVPAP